MVNRHPRHGNKNLYYKRNVFLKLEKRTPTFYNTFNSFTSLRSYWAQYCKYVCLFFIIFVNIIKNVQSSQIYVVHLLKCLVKYQCKNSLNIFVKVCFSMEGWFIYLTINLTWHNQKKNIQPTNLQPFSHTPFFIIPFFS